MSSTPAFRRTVILAELESILAQRHTDRGHAYKPTGIPVDERSECRAGWLHQAVKAIGVLEAIDHEQIADEMEAARHDAIADVIASPPAAFARNTANDFEGTEK